MFLYILRVPPYIFVSADYFLANEGQFFASFYLDLANAHWLAHRTTNPTHPVYFDGFGVSWGSSGVPLNTSAAAILPDMTAIPSGLNDLLGGYQSVADSAIARMEAAATSDRLLALTAWSNSPGMVVWIEAVNNTRARLHIELSVNFWDPVWGSNGDQPPTARDLSDAVVIVPIEFITRNDDPVTLAFRHMHQWPAIPDITLTRVPEARFGFSVQGGINNFQRNSRVRVGGAGANDGLRITEISVVAFNQNNYVLELDIVTPGFRWTEDSAVTTGENAVRTGNRFGDGGVGVPVLSNGHFNTITDDDAFRTLRFNMELPDATSPNRLALDWVNIRDLYITANYHASVGSVEVDVRLREAAGAAITNWEWSWNLAIAPNAVTGISDANQALLSSTNGPTAIIGQQVAGPDVSVRIYHDATLNTGTGGFTTTATGNEFVGEFVSAPIWGATQGSIIASEVIEVARLTQVTTVGGGGGTLTGGGGDDGGDGDGNGGGTTVTGGATPGRQANQARSVNVPTESGFGVSATVSGERITINLTAQSQINNIIQNTEGDTVTFDVSGEDVVTALVHQQTLVSFARAGLSVEIQLPLGSITLDPAAIFNAVDNAQGSHLMLTITAADNLTPAQQNAVQDGEQVLRFGVHHGNPNNPRSLSSFGDGSLTFTIPHSGTQAPAVWHLNNAGEREYVESTFNAEDQTVTFTVNSLSVYIIGQREELLEAPILPEVAQAQPIATLVRLEIGTELFTVNGQTIHGGYAPFIDPVYSRSMVPLRMVAESLGAEVNWLPETRTVTVAGHGRFLVLPLDEALPDGMGVPMIVNDRTFVPINYIAQMLGAEVRWDAGSQAIYIQQWV